MVTREGQALAARVRRLTDFAMVEDLHLPYHHMGATITDGVPQAGLRYETEVWPRVQRTKGSTWMSSTHVSRRVVRK